MIAVCVKFDKICLQFVQYKCGIWGFHGSENDGDLGFGAMYTRL